MKRLTFLLFLIPLFSEGQISFFNMPNPDMLGEVGNAYAEYDLYQTLKGNPTVNASVFRLSVQATKFLEVGANAWFNADHPQDPNRIVLATKWKANLYQKGNLSISMSPGSWSSIYFTENTPAKNIIYDFIGITHQEGPQQYTRFMIGVYGKYIGSFESSTYGLMAGIEHRVNNHLEIVADYFQGSGEGYGLAPGFVYYALEQGNNLPLYFAYQFDNDSRDNDLLLFEVGYFLRMWKPRGK